MKIFGTNETFNDYKKTGLYIAFPKCKLNCLGCQNVELKKKIPLNIDVGNLVNYVLNNPIIDSIICSGLNPMDSFYELQMLIHKIRKFSKMDIIIYTGYKEEDLVLEISVLKQYPNITIKFGEYIKDCDPIYDEILQVTLASNNQYAKKIS